MVEAFLLGGGFVVGMVAGAILLWVIVAKSVILPW